MAPKQNQKKAKAKRTPLQVASASFVDQLGKAAVDKLKTKLGLNTEVKSIDYSTSAALTSTLAMLTTESSNPITQGDSDSQREGSTCRVTRFDIRGCVVNGAANLDPNTMVRIVGVRFTPVPGNFVSNATAFASVLANGGAGGFPELLSPTTLRQDQSYKNTVIFDESFALGPTGTFPTGQFFRKDYHPDDLHLEWIASDTAGTLTNAIGEHIVFYGLASQATASNFPVVKLSQRVYYVDN
jgi:hypothetical protein